MRMKFSNWLREPLLHLLLLGGLLFAIDYLISGRADDPRVIAIDASVDREAREVFRTSRDHEPNDEELYALRRVWLDNEVLYREGLALALDRGDATIRNRVVFKMLSIVDAGLKLPAHEDDALREWFEKNRVKYDEPARYDFQEAVLAGAPTEPATRAFAAALNAGSPSENMSAGLRVFKGRPQENLVQSYGEGFAKSIQASSGDQWHALAANDGWRVVRLQSVTPPKPADFETLRGVVLQDWTDATMAELRTNAVRTLAKKYVVKVESVAP